VRAGLSQSSVIALMAPPSIASALQRMQRPASSRMDLDLARELAMREGVKAIVDGDITGVGTATSCNSARDADPGASGLPPDGRWAARTNRRGGRHARAA
jgi:hypothetical protein